jgi:uncharacterized protein YegL
LFLFTDGSGTDSWQRELETLKQNTWFEASRKFGVAIGEDADIDMLKEFTGSAESVVQTFNAVAMMKTILENTDTSPSREDSDVW